MQVPKETGPGGKFIKRKVVKTIFDRNTLPPLAYRKSHSWKIDICAHISFVLFYFDLFRFVSICFVLFRFVLYRNPFNDNSRYPENIFTIDNPKFDQHILDVYWTELQLNKANTSEKATFIWLISTPELSTNTMTLDFI